MSIDPTPDWSPDADIASLLSSEREDTMQGAANANARIWHRLEMHSVGAAAAAASITAAAGGVSHAEMTSGAASVASVGAVKALAWKVGAVSMLLVAGGVIGASLEARLATPAAPPRVISTLAEPRQGTSTAPVASSSMAPEDSIPTVDVESLPRVPLPSPAVPTHPASPPAGASGSTADPTGSHGTAPSTSSGDTSAAPISSSPATSLGEEQRLLDTARTAVTRGAYSSAITSLTEHQTRFPAGRLTEERELLYVQALAGSGDTAAAQARAKAFAERFPRSIFLPAVRAVSASQER